MINPQLLINVITTQRNAALDSLAVVLAELEKANQTIAQLEKGQGISTPPSSEEC